MKIEKDIEEMKEQHNNEDEGAGIILFKLIGSVVALGFFGLVVYFCRDIIFGIGYH